MLNSEEVYGVTGAVLAVLLGLFYWFTWYIVKHGRPAAVGWVLAGFSVASVAVLLGVALSTNQLSWMQFGLGNGFTLAGVFVSTQWQYCCIVVYQVARCLLGCLVSDAFRSHMLKLQAQLEAVDARTLVWWQLANTACTVFAFVATISDLFIFLTKLDLTLVSLVVTVVADWVITDLLVQYNKNKKKEATKIESQHFTQEQLDELKTIVEHLIEFKTPLHPAPLGSLALARTARAAASPSLGLRFGGRLLDL